MRTTEQYTGAAVILKMLGVDTIFRYPSGAIMPIYEELFRQSRIRRVLVRHEAGAAHGLRAMPGRPQTGRSPGHFGAGLDQCGHALGRCLDGFDPHCAAQRTSPDDGAGHGRLSRLRFYWHYPALHQAQLPDQAAPQRGARFFIRAAG